MEVLVTISHRGRDGCHGYDECNAEIGGPGYGDPKDQSPGSCEGGLTGEIVHAGYGSPRT